MANPKPQVYDTTPKLPPKVDSLTNTSPSYEIKKGSNVPTQSDPSTTGQGRNTGAEASDYQKYLNDGVNQKDWRDPIADSSALNKQAQAMLEKQLKQVADMNREAASKKGREERQTQMQQQMSNERIAQMQNQQTYEKKDPFQSSATLQYNANTAEKLSRYASKEAQQQAAWRDDRRITNQFKQDRLMAMKQRGHEARQAYNDRLGQKNLALIQGQQAKESQRSQLKLQETQDENALKRIAAESAARYKESQMQLAGQKEIAAMQAQADIQKTVMNSMASIGRGNNYGGYW